MPARSVSSCILLLLALIPRPATAQSAPAASAPRLEVSGYIQPQYQSIWTDDATRDRAFVRRMVASLDVEVSASWRAEFQVDAGPTVSGGDRLIVKNALVQYTGLESRGLVLSAGNQKAPFSRSVFGSSSRRVFVERPFTGERAFGSPGRVLSLRADGAHADGRLQWNAAIGEARHGTDPDEIRLEGAAEAEDDTVEGRLAAARVEWHPLGAVKLEQSDVSRGPLRATVAAAVYGWWNDGDRQANTPAVSSTSALELSGAVRVRGLFVDVEYERVTSDADRALSVGLYAAGHAALHKMSVEAGYQLVPSRLELAASADRLDARVFETPWHRVAAGVVWYMRGHDLKLSVMHRESFGDEGRHERRSHATYVQTHVGF